MEPTPDARSIFGHALGIESPTGRAEYLDEVCGGDAGLRAEVEGLLAANGRAGEFMRRPAAVAAGITVSPDPITEGPGTRIGPYKLLQQIGEGGMGVVYMAEQEQPVRRKVALKIIKPGMDTKQVVARFEAERQALAMMDHANIARVFDAGATESGRPYFVMELVHGVPITEYCDANRLTPRERLGLFVPVCQAIQHAHQKGVIHRDIKPSNVLVTMYDDKPVPKVIDFGVAKAVEQRLTEKTLFTQFGALVGTFEYMSPEQAEMNAFGVDTRSDIYALGVLLYELLTGTTPLERPRLREAAYGEIVRLIKEEEPPRPSTRLSTSGTLAKVAAARQTEPAKLSRLMRGELDWVVMRCLEKDRSRRYDTASGLARDVERYLKDEPVEARPPSAWYRLRKAARRNRTALSVAGVVAAVLVLGTAVSLWQASLARAERDRARLAEAAREAEHQEHERELVAERRQYALDRAIEAAFSSEPAKAHKAIVEAEMIGVAPDRVHWLHGLVHHYQSQFEDALREYDASIALKPSVAAYASRQSAIFEAWLQTGKSLGGGFTTKEEWLDSMSPETAEDYLCRGYWTSGSVGPQTLPDLDKAIVMRDTPIARAIRASGLTQSAFETGDAALIDRALDDIRLAKLRLSDSTFVRARSLAVQMRAIDLYGKTGRTEERKTAVEEAERDARALANAPGFGYVLFRVRYFEFINDDKAALAELERASQRPESAGVTAHYALRLYEKGQDGEALNLLDKRLPSGNVAGEMLRVILWADEIGRDKALERYREQVAARRGGADATDVRLFEVPTLVLLGKRKEAADLFRSGLARYPTTVSIRPVDRFLAEDQSEAECLAQAGKNPKLLCTAHFIIGLARLSEGDRDVACEHFQKALDTDWWGTPSYTQARAYLARLKRDPEWPKWIPVKK